MKKYLHIVCFLILFAAFLPHVAVAECTCEEDDATHSDKTKVLQFKLAGLFSVLVAGSIGVSLPLLGKRIPALAPESDVFFMIKAFAAGVILATAMIHILPDAFKNLTSPCLSQAPWRDFPFAGFVAMMAAIGNLMVDSMATAYFKRTHFKKVIAGGSSDEEKVVSSGIVEAEHSGHVHVHTHGTHGHSHGSAPALVVDGSDPSPLHEHSSSSVAAASDLIRHRIVSQVLELGIVVHSVIIGVSLGAAVNLETIKSLLVALSFHQFFEGMGLGSCISQANFKNRSVLIMSIFFSLTTPAGIAIGVGVSNVYRENSPTTLIVQGMFNSASAGILIYMALVDILAADFMNQRMQTSMRLQFGSYISLLLGAGCMSSLAKWA